jgi:intein/homing endonuclease
MSIKALADYTQYSKYAKYIPEKKRRETWNEQVERVFKMHEDKLGDKLKDIKEDFEFAKDMLKRKRVLGSQRALQFGGDAILNKQAKMYNCSASYVDRVDFFKESMYLLLCFEPDTLVKTKDGDKKIKDITCKDQVLAYCEDTDSFIWVYPSNSFETPTESYKKLKLTFEDGSEVICTDNHLFYTTNRGWVEAKHLDECDDVKFFKK